MKNYVIGRNLKKISDLGKVYLTIALGLAANVGVFFLPTLSVKIIALIGLIILYEVCLRNRICFFYIRNNYESYPFAAGVDFILYSAILANLILLTKYNGNNHPLTMEIIAIGIIVLLLLLFEVGKAKFNDYKSFFNRPYAFLSGVLSLVAVVNLYINFGSLFIWLSIAIILLMAWTNILDVVIIIFSKLSKREKFLTWMTIVLILLGLISTLCQFWRNIISGLGWFFSYNLFGVSIFSWLIILAGASLSFFIFRKFIYFIEEKRKIILAQKKEKESELARIEEKKAKKETEEQQEKEWEEAIKREAEHYIEGTQAYYARSETMCFSSCLWFMKYPHSEALKYFLDRYGRKKFISPLNIYNFISISDKKKQIIFDEKVKTLFVFLEFTARGTFDDDLLNTILIVTDGLFTPYERPNGGTWEEYRGLNKLREMFYTYCPTIKKLREQNRR